LGTSSPAIGGAIPAKGVAMSSAITLSQPKSVQAKSYCIVAACDFSPLGDRAVREALRLCSTQGAAALHVITVGSASAVGVVLPGPELRFRMQQEAEELAREHLKQIVDEFITQTPALPLEKIAVYVTVGVPSECIVALATAVDADLIVLGTHGRHGLERIMLGSVAEAVVRHAPCGVFVIRPRDFLAGENALLSYRTQPTYHYVHRLSRKSERLMPSL
jgi:nucleotide-binding universal stress UspA family protein